MKSQLAKNKWFLAFVIVAVIAVAAIIVAIVVGVTSAKVPDEPEYVEGDEIGSYYYDVVDGEVLLTLSGGNKFTISGPQINKTGTYTVDGATINLDFFKDEDGTSTATINGDTIALVYENATMTFLKKITYTFSFNVNGGNKIDAAKVINGKTATKPADPTKENNVFLGWYADEALTIPYSFDTTTIKADTTIYARWAEKKPGVEEYTVQFDLGYESAPKMNSISTISGIAYDVAVPEREGYVFGGWWISMYDDGEKLTYAYTDDVVFTEDTTLFAVWYESGSTKLNAPAVSVTDTAITWDAVSNAASYKLTVALSDGTTLIDNETVGTTTKAFNFSENVPGEYKITVVAVASNAENNSEPAVRYYANKALDRVSNFIVENGILVFGAVENAQKYTLSIDCGNDSHVHSAFDNGASTTYYIGNCTMQEGGIRITVTASANDYASSTSKVFVYDRTLEKIENLRYDEKNDRFVWNAVTGAASYKVTVKTGNNEYTFNNAGISFSVAGFTGDITVSVVPATDGYNSPAAVSATCKKTAPATPSGLTAAGNKISWNAVDGATSYDVKIGTQNVTVSTNELDIVNLTLTQGQVYSVKVKAINANNESSAYTEEISVGYFVMSPNVTYSQNTVYWAPVLGVSQYQVRVNGGTAITVKNATSAKVTLTKEGENLIEVRYVYDDTVSDWVSATVTAVAVEYDTRSITSGSFLIEYLAVGDVMTLPNTGFSNEGYDFSGWYNAPKGVAGNGKLYAEGSVFTGNMYTVVYADWSPKTYSVTLKTEGFQITNIENGTEMPATYTKDFTLTVPVANNTGIYYFAGWYTGPSGTGIQLTDETGASVNPYPLTRDITVYPYYSTNALTFTLQADGTYAVSKGEAIANVTNLTIPVTYNEIPVTTILESAFAKCTKLVRISIPDTITLVGTGAFTSCSKLEYIDVYVAKPEEEGTYETFYSDDNGILIREDMGTTYLEVVPRAMTGSYEIPSYVEKITPKAFYYSSLSSIKIPDNILSIGEYTFYYCSNLKTIEFAYGRTNEIEVDPKAFYNCTAVESVKLPANINLDVATVQAMLEGFTSLKFVEAEEGGANYATVNGFLTNGEKDTILFCPAGLAGDISIPSGIKTIGANAFKARKYITSVTIPVWVTTIDEYAFYQCYEIKTITFKGSRTEDLSIGKDAFAYIKALQSITFEGNGTDALDTGKVTIGQYAFTVSSTDAKNLRTLTIGDGVNIDTIGDHAFYMQDKLREINISEKASVTTIGTYAFAKCAGILSFTVPATVTMIDQYAFSDCANLVALNFATEGATEITFADYAFNGCTKLGSVTLPDHLKEFKSLAFEGCDALKSILVNDTNKNYLNDENGILYKKESESSSTPTELLFYPKGLARENNGVVNNLPDTLTKIGSSSFANNSFLKSITIPKSITVIDTSAFANCENLTSVYFEDGGTTLTVGDKAFSTCASLTDIMLPSYTTKIGANAFEMSGLTTFTVPAKVATISKAAFYMCEKLKEVKFNSEVAITIGSDGSSATNGVFSKCYALESVEIPASATTIGKYAFNECTSLKSVTFAADSKLTTIDNNAFFKCSNIKTITIPKSVTKIGNAVFAMGTSTSNAVPGSLEAVIFEQGGTAALEIGTTVFTYQPNLKSVTFPARTSKLGGAVAPTSTYTASSPISAMFTSDTALAEINIAVEAGVTPKFASIDGVLYTADKTILIFCPFANVGRYENGEPTYEIVIPKTVTLVLTKAFMDNSALKTVTFEEFDKTDSKYGTQLLTIGNYASGTAVTTATIGGNTSSITTINLPSHLKKIGPVAFASKSETPITLTINSDASNITLAKYAFAFCGATSIAIPGTVTFAATDTNIFSDCTFMETLSVTFPSSITKIPDNTFKNCAALTSYEIPEQITEIGKSAFDGCASLTSMTLSDKITKLGDTAFANCSSLASVTLGKNITSIGKSAFQLSGLTSLTIPSTYTASIFSATSPGVFDQCTSLVTVTFELDENGKSNMTELQKYMFQNCTALTTINLEDLELTKIGQSAFNKCSSLSDVDFTKLTLLNTAENNAFSYTALETVDLSKTQITSITNAFNNISTLKSMVFPKTVTTLSTAAFTNDKALQMITLSENQTGEIFANTAFSSISAKVVIPEGNTNFYIDEFGVIYDPDRTTIFHVGGKQSTLEGYTIPASVLTINQYAFAYATMDSLVIPEGVMEIGQYAFRYADIPFISVPSSVTTIGNYAFEDSGLKQIEFANERNSKLEFIGRFAFSGSDLERIVLPDNLNLTKDSYSLFMDCTSLKSVTFGAAVKYIPGNTLGNCTALEEIIFQEGLEEISYLFNAITGLNNFGDDDRALANNVKTITIPSTVKSLGVSQYDTTDMGSTFACFKNLETVIFAEGSQLEYIKHDAFMNCVSLKNINIPDTVIEIDEDAFYGCVSLESLDLSKTGVTVIREYTFYDTPSLNNLILPEGTETIEQYAFYNSGITEITITEAITEIGVSAFENAASLKTVTFDPDNMLTTLGSDTEATNIFKGTTSLETVTITNFLMIIGNNVFENSGVKEVVLADPDTPSALRTVGEYAFANCANLTDFNILESAKTIGDCAFFNCTSLTNVNVSEGLETLGAMAFAFCENLPEAPIPATVLNLGGNAYAGLPADKIKFNPNNKYMIAETDASGALTIYDSTKSILYAVYDASGDYVINEEITLVMPGALAGTDITSITVPKKLETVADFLFMNCDKLVSVTIEDGITEIGQYAFYGTGLTTVVIPSTVTTINDYAFANCASINNVTIPVSVKTMGNYLFAYCTTLSDFEFEENTTTSAQVVGTHFFYNCPNITEVILPTKINITIEEGNAVGSYSSYRTTIPSYMFAGTGIVHAVIPASITYFHTVGVFENCKNLETVTYMYNTTSTSPSYSKTWYVGCDKLEGAYIDSITHYMGYVFELCYTAGLPSLHVGSIDESPDLYATARFSYAGDLTIYFDGNTWQEIVDYMAIVSKVWDCTIFDKDGNQLFCSETNGSIAYVKDANGNTIWSAEQ